MTTNQENFWNYYQKQDHQLLTTDEFPAYTGINLKIIKKPPPK